MSLEWRICNNSLHEAELMWIGENEYEDKAASIFITSNDISLVYNTDGKTYIDKFEKGKNLKEIEQHLKGELNI